MEHSDVATDERSEKSGSNASRTGRCTSRRAAAAADDEIDRAATDNERESEPDMSAVTAAEAARVPADSVWISEHEERRLEALTLNLAEGSMGTEGSVRFRRERPMHTSSDAHS